MVEYLKIGQISNAHGIKGEVKVYPLTDDVKRFSKLAFVFLNEKDIYRKVEVESVKYLKQFVVLKLNGIEDMNQALKYKNVYIYVDRENAVKLPKGSYFISDLIGLDVSSNEGNYLGKIIDVFSTGSNDVYEVKSELGKSILLPAIKEVILQIDIENRRMLVKLLEGLI
jgi:16S rRNA processing protein RimM